MVFKSMKVIILFCFLMVSFKNFCEANEKTGFDLNAVNLKSVAQKVQWHGYYEFEYWDKEDQRNSFDAHKITLWMGLPINKKVFLSTEIEYEHFPRLEGSGKERTGGNGEIKLDSAQLRINPIGKTNFYLGVFYVPFGIEYESYAGHKNKLITRPKVMKGGGIIPGTWSDVGIGFNQGVSRAGQLDIYLINGDAKNGGISRDSSFGGNENKSVGLRLKFDDLIEGLDFGGSWVHGRWDSKSHYSSSRYGSHLKIEMDKIFGKWPLPVLIAEYVDGVDEAVYYSFCEDYNFSICKDSNLYGYYIQLSSRVYHTVELVARYGEYDNNKDATDNQLREISFGMVYHLWDNFQIKGEYQHMEGRSNDTIVAQVVAFW